MLYGILSRLSLIFTQSRQRGGGVLEGAKLLDSMMEFVSEFRVHDTSAPPLKPDPEKGTFILSYYNIL